MQPAQLYDSAATMFSPDGRIYQVEYAREAVKRGTAAVGITYRDGVLLLVDRRSPGKLVEIEAIEKLYKIDDHIGAASSGLVGDARVLVARAREEVQSNRFVYSEPIELGVLVKTISDILQAYTQNGGVRPFGAALLFGGYDSRGIHLYETDPSGAVIAYKASAIGNGRAQAMEYLEGSYRDGLTLKEAWAMGKEAVRRASEGAEGRPTSPEGAVVERGKGFRKLQREEVAELES